MSLVREHILVRCLQLWTSHFTVSSMNEHITILMSSALEQITLPYPHTPHFTLSSVQEHMNIMRPSALEQITLLYPHTPHFTMSSVQEHITVMRPSALEQITLPYSQYASTLLHSVFARNVLNCWTFHSFLPLVHVRRLQTRRSVLAVTNIRFLSYCRALFLNSTDSKMGSPFDSLSK